jgi:hypothetical protein|tara:strand:- start:39 stop:587 length:549 start_codon:yes stop_codon:yes gene_type:complete
MSESTNAFTRQIQNRNFLSPAGFKFSLAKAPKVDFFSQSVSIPNIDLGVAVQTTYLRDIPVPGDKLVYGDLDIEFFIDENLENYLQIERWMRSLGYPESLAETVSLDPQKDSLLDGARSDGTLLVYNSSFNPIAKILFKDMFPTSLTPVPFTADVTDINYIMATATFKYTIFNVESLVENES